jgi:hypothetical protein
MFPAPRLTGLPRVGMIYEDFQYDPRLTFLGAPSLYQHRPAAAKLRQLRQRAKKEGKITIREVPNDLSMIYQEEEGIFPDGARYKTSSHWMRNPRMIIQTPWTKDATTQTDTDMTETDRLRRDNQKLTRKMKQLEAQLRAFMLPK